ncbi:enoyl-CoA hydratase/isomerase family protein [Kocuria coralli]|uniref:3-hydroxyisobutyryl-CoA hydrolase n=1 Tax=Kocuria coralli TaxID=1461025 RepID=A0A5J5KX15_9MICC|nr:enoyl-CoA hydratase/isomerase family protein [Kocuria coralli]KAA9394223.1 enoyl-CoA hydratase/isomerase family protein [Kocuria coralli]
MTQSTVPADPEQYVRAEVRHRTGVITLDRPKALNALTAKMYRDLLECLWVWSDDDSVDQVLIHASASRAFCAGGDIRQVRQAVLDGEIERGMGAFTDEYTLNNLIAGYPKPYIALMEGYTMGGGMGLSVHGSHRIVTENTVMAMPECVIGFFPDIGASWFLPRMSLLGRGPSLAVARWMGLGGQRISGADAVAVGLADVLVPSERLDRFRELAISDGVEAAISEFAATAADGLPDTSLAEAWDQIEQVYGADSLPEVLAAAGEELAGASPSSLVRTWELLDAGAAASSVTECLERELAFARATISAPDFSEGVRCALIDKEDSPQWSPATVEEVDVAAIKAVLGASEPLRERP